ncbi:hypothetical protein LP414_27840 [Polaromonas sp. P1(28)-13]|nr:hypothetical protein LP414_27840 [Polaromonas sp. P1(28)-13]
MIRKINADEASAVAAAGYLKAPNDIQEKGAGKKKKAPQNDPTDGLLLKMDADAKFLLKAKAKMAGMTGDMLDIASLRVQAQEEIDQIMDQDRRLYTVHEKGDVEKAVEQLTNRKVMEEALREQAALFPRLEAGKERLRQLNEQVASGMFIEGDKNTEENKILILLERISKMSPEAALAMAPVIKARKELLETSAGIDVATAMIVGEKSLRDQRIGGIVNDREKIAAEGKKEVDDLTTKYGLLIAEAKKYNKDTTGLQAQLTESLELQAKRQSRALETPLEKLAIDWKDTTKAMGVASASAATGFVDMLVDGMEKGSINIKGFLLSVVKDIASAQLKNSLADPLKQIMGVGTNMLSSALFGKTTEKANPAKTALTDPLVEGASALAKMGATAFGAGDALTSMAKGGVSEAAIAAAQSAISSATSGTASATFSSAIMSATSAVAAFAAALKVASGGSAAAGGGGIGDFLGDLFGGGGAQDASTLAGLESLIPGFANGGIMTNYGPVSLRKYAQGGIMNSPQLALYGEAGPEAYVPLPDGRSIPVTMQNGGAAPNVTVNVINQSGNQVSAQKGQPRFDGKQMILDVVLSAVNTPGPFRDGMKGAVGG